MRHQGKAQPGHSFRLGSIIGATMTSRSSLPVTLPEIPADTVAADTKESRR